MPRWGLRDPISPVAAPQTRSAAVSVTAVRATLLASAGVFALGAAAHALRYLLLLVNRSTLLPPLVADGALLMGVLVSLAALVSMIASMAVCTSWLIARRAEAFRLRGQDDPRPAWALWAGCLTPVANLVWAPVFVIELAHAEQCHRRMQGRITAWWASWVCSALLAGWASWTSSATDAQGVADNTVSEVLAYLAGVTALLMLLRVVDGFVRRPVQQRPSHRWVVVAEPRPAGPAGPVGPVDTVDTVDPGDPVDRGRADAGNADVIESRDPEPAA